VSLELITLGPSAWPALQPLTALRELEELVLADSVGTVWRGAEHLMRVPVLADFRRLRRFRFSGGLLVRLCVGLCRAGARSAGPSMGNACSAQCIAGALSCALLLLTTRGQLLYATNTLLLHPLKNMQLTCATAHPPGLRACPTPAGWRCITGFVL
jgi:hypothetical protein